MNRKHRLQSIATRTSLLFLLLFCSVLQAEQAAAPSAGALAGKEIAMVIAFDQFKDSELLIPKQLFEAEGALVTVVSSQVGMATGMDGATIKSELPLTSLDVGVFDAIVFIGGRGTNAFWNDPAAHRVVQETVQQGKILGAICWAPVILANAGVLTDKKATVFNNSGNEAVMLKEKGCSYTGEAVTRDGLIITANGPKAADPFARSIISSLAER